MHVGCSFNMFSMSSEQIDDNHNQRINITELENPKKDIPLLVLIYIEFFCNTIFRRNIPGSTLEIFGFLF